MKTKLLITAVTSCLLVALTGVGSAAAEEETIAGWTEAEFYAGAASLGVPEETYLAAWGDVALMETVPVAVVESFEDSSRPATREEQRLAVADGGFAPTAVVTAVSVQRGPIHLAVFSLGSP